MAPGGYKTISTLSRAGLSAGQILTTLRSLEPEISLIPKDIYNFTQKARLEECHGLNAMSQSSNQVYCKKVLLKKKENYYLEERRIYIMA
jgi:hypothetical protein